MKARSVDLIVVHCSASKPGAAVDAAEIRRWHLARGFNDIGYHFVILPDGTIQQGRPVEQIGAHAAGYNSKSIGICLVGGLNEKGRPTANFSREQYNALRDLLEKLRQTFPNTKIRGHRDLPNVNKDCPCFDVRSWCAQHGIDAEAPRP